MNSIGQCLITVGAFLLGNVANAQRATSTNTLYDFSHQRIRHQKTLGLALGGYALANIAAGSIMAGQTTGEASYFHRMNIYWNLVNLGIAGVGLLGSRNVTPGDETLAQAVRRHETMKEVLLVNAGLDVAYVLGGAYLQERGQSRPDKRDQLQGYGKSIMLQGGFLLAFDLVNYFIFKSRGDKQEIKLLSAGPMGVGLAMPIR